MNLRQFISQDKTFIFQDNVFFQADLKQSRFEETYLSLREKEHRIYEDEIVARLPHVEAGHPFETEWKMRKFSAENLFSYIKRQDKPVRILEIGCGNGWLANYLARIPDADVIGLDINKRELLQAARVFAKANLTFACADLFRLGVGCKFDIIVLASAIQYFQDVSELLAKLFSILANEGEIHILDSPFYDPSKIDDARKRSADYFVANDSEMITFYFHHHWKSLERFKTSLLYDPLTLKNRVKKNFIAGSPFPWIRIRN